MAPAHAQVAQRQHLPVQQSATFSYVPSDNYTKETLMDDDDDDDDDEVIFSSVCVCVRVRA